VALAGVAKGDYTVPRDEAGHGHNGHNHGGRGPSIESIAFMLLAGVVVGLLVGFGLDHLMHTMPAFTLVGVFAGFGIALYGVYLETK
jgi:F0F1-type ATP synthase assembly protein I